MASDSFSSPLRRTECVERLKNAIAGQSGFTGQVDPDGFRISCKTPYRNSFKPEIRGRFSDGGAGTLVTYAVGPAPLVLAVLAVVAVAFTGATLYTLAVAPGAATKPATGLAMLIGVLALSRLLSRNDADTLVGLVRKMLLA
jgi:hypothetical protein